MKHFLFLVLLLFGINANANEITLNFISTTSENATYEITYCQNIEVGCTVGDRYNVSSSGEVMVIYNPQPIAMASSAANDEQPSNSAPSPTVTGMIAGKLIYKEAGHPKITLCGVVIGIVNYGEALVVVTAPGTNCPTQAGHSTKSSAYLTEPVVQIFKGTGFSYTAQVCVACRSWLAVKAAASGQSGGSGFSSTVAGAQWAGFSDTAGLVQAAEAVLAGIVGG